MTLHTQLEDGYFAPWLTMYSTIPYLSDDGYTRGDEAGHRKGEKAGHDIDVNAGHTVTDDSSGGDTDTKNSI